MKKKKIMHCVQCGEKLEPLDNLNSGVHINPKICIQNLRDKIVQMSETFLSGCLVLNFDPTVKIVDEKKTHLRKMNELFALCQKFITENGIGLPECIYQNDHVIQNAYEFIENVCDIVGYATYDEEDDA